MAKNTKKNISSTGICKRKATRKKSRFEQYFYGQWKADDYPLHIAEISANHQSSLAKACELIRSAAFHGADAVKIQTYRPESMTLNCSRDEFLVKDSPWKGEKLWDLYQQAHTPYHWHTALFATAKEIGIPLFSTPFDKEGVLLLESCGCPVYKIASFELCDHTLLRAVAETGKPLILSTGMASLEEVDSALECVLKAGAQHITILHCTSAYPTPLSRAHLEHIPYLKHHLAKIQSRRTIRVGLSDHTLAEHSAVVATLLGAQLIEKHFTLSRLDKGPDSSFSMEPEEFKKMVASCKAIKELISNALHMPNATWTRSQSTMQTSERDMRLLRRSLFIIKEIKRGEKLTQEHVASLRPASGLSPSYLNQILGKSVNKDLAWSHPLSLDDFIDIESN